MTEQEIMRKYPCVLVSWATIADDINWEHPTINDQLLILTKEMSDLGINHYMCDEELKPLNNLFGLNPKIKNFDYGVQSLSIYGYDYGSCSRNARITLKYKTGNWRCEYCIKFNEPSTYPNMRTASSEEIMGIIDFLNGMISAKKALIKKQSGNPSYEEFVQLCEKHAQHYVYNNADRYAKEDEINVRLVRGKTQVERAESTAIVIYVGEPLCINQIGHIKICQDRHGMFGFSCSVPLCGEYGETLNDWNDYKSVLNNMIDYICDSKTHTIGYKYIIRR